MPRESIMTGKTVDEALRKAKEELGVTDEDTGFEILEMPRSSFFGLKKTPAKVRVYLIEEEPPQKPAAPRKAPAERPAAAEKAEKPAPAQRPEKPAAADRAQKPAPVEKPAPAERDGGPAASGKPADRPARAEKPPKAQAPKQKEPKPEGPQKAEGARKPQQKPAREQPAAPISFTPEEELSEKAKAAIRYVSDILEAMGVQEAVVRAKQSPESIELYLEGSGLGVIIGRRGETLDAVQYLTSLVANRMDGDYVRISIDSGDYRQKRTETLEHLAQKLARNAVKTGRSTRLEPMNPYERRIIHAAVSKVEGATSSSIGEEPNRRVVISPKGARKKPEGDGRRENSRPGSGPRGGRDGRRDPRRYDRPRPAAAAAGADKAEKINDGEIEIPQELAPKPLAAPQPAPKAAAAAPHTPTAEEKDALPLYGKMDL